MLTTEKLCIGLKKDKKESTMIVKDVSFSLEKGQSLTILGQSGCGKTMTCSAIMDLLDKQRFIVKGKILFDGKNMTDLSGKEKRSIYGRRIAYIPQNPMTALDPSMRIGRQMDETMKLHTALDKETRRGKILSSLETAGLSEPERIWKSYPYMLSGGMLQRVLVAMSVMTDASLVIADEPTTALDVVHRNEIIDEFISLRIRGAAVIVVTHDFAAALRLGGRLLVMKEGHILEEGETMSVFKDPKHDYTKRLITESQLSQGGVYALC